MGGSPQFKNLSSFSLTAHHLKQGLQGHHDYLPQAGKGGKTWRVTHGRVYESGMDVTPSTSYFIPFTRTQPHGSPNCRRGWEMQSNCEPRKNRTEAW